MNVRENNKTLNISMGIYFFIMVAFIAIRLLSSFGFLNFLGDWTSYIFTLVVQLGLLVCGSVFVFSGIKKQKVKKTLKFYQVRNISKKSFFIAIAMGILVFFINVFVSSFFSEIIHAFGYERTTTGGTMTEYPVWLLFVNIIFTALLPAIGEEISHRGMLLRSMKRFGFWKAILLSGLLFGLLHLNIEQFFYATIIGIFLGFITSICGSIWPAVIIHFMNNALSVFLTFSQVRGLSFANIFTKIEMMLSNNLALGIIFVIALVACLIYLLYLLTIYLFVDSAKTTLIRNKNFMDKMMKKGAINISPVNEEKMAISISLDEDIDFEDLPDMFSIPLKRDKMETVNKILITSCIIMMLAITIFTFVWGII